MFIKFLMVGPTLHLDGFVFALPGDQFGQEVNRFGQVVRRVLKCISDNDPKGFHCMNKSYVSKIGWSFEFDGIPIFVTTFAPCYPSNHARYTFGASEAFILLQPMYSFAIHDIGPDTPHTNWDSPVSVRDKIRVAFKENGRAYHVRDTIYYPAAHDIVKPLKEGVGDLVEWWVDPDRVDGEEGEEGKEEEEEEEREEEREEGEGGESGEESSSGDETVGNESKKKQ